MELLSIVFDAPIVDIVNQVYHANSSPRVVDLVLFKEAQELRDKLHSFLFETFVTTKNGNIVRMSSMSMLFLLPHVYKSQFLADFLARVGEEQDRQAVSIFFEKVEGFSCSATHIENVLQCSSSVAKTIEAVYESMGNDTWAFLQQALYNELEEHDLLEVLTDEEVEEFKTAIFSYLDEMFG